MWRENFMGCVIRMDFFSFPNWHCVKPSMYFHLSQERSESEVKLSVAQSCLTLCDLMDCSPPGSSVHGILQASILEWLVIPFSRGSLQPRDWTWISCNAGRFLTIESSGKPHKVKVKWLFFPSYGPCVSWSWFLSFLTLISNHRW